MDTDHRLPVRPCPREDWLRSLPADAVGLMESRWTQVGQLRGRTVHLRTGNRPGPVVPSVFRAVPSRNWYPEEDVELRQSGFCHAGSKSGVRWLYSSVWKTPGVGRRAARRAIVVRHRTIIWICNFSSSLQKVPRICFGEALGFGLAILGAALRRDVTRRYGIADQSPVDAK